MWVFILAYCIARIGPGKVQVYYLKEKVYDAISDQIIKECIVWNSSSPLLGGCKMTCQEKEKH